MYGNLSTVQSYKQSYTGGNCHYYSILDMLSIHTLKCEHKITHQGKHKIQNKNYSHAVYLDLARIFLRLRFSLRILFLRH